jgi:small subunit ribosomal protein S6
LAADKLEAFKSKVDSILTAGKGQIVRLDEWGRRRLAYPVRKELFGYYLLYDYRAEAAVSAELERQLKIDEQVFKFLTLVLDKNFTEDSLKAVLERLASAASPGEKSEAAKAAPVAAADEPADEADAPAEDDSDDQSAETAAEAN